MDLEAAARDLAPDALKAALAEALAALAPSLGPKTADPGSRAARSALVDSVVRGLAAKHGLGPSSDVAVLAAGGYGRRELAPRSDVDLLVLAGDGARAAVEGLVRSLWDAGFEVGSAVRDDAGALAALARDLHAATATLEGRFVAGDRRPFARLRDAVLGSFLPASAPRFAAAKLEEMRERHARRGGTIFLLAPDLKEGRGTMRDLELVRLLAALGPWLHVDGAPRPSPEAAPDLVLPGLARADDELVRWLRLGPDERLERVQGEALIASARAAVHELEPVRSERIGRAIEDALAARFGYRRSGGRLGAENFLRDVFRAAKAVDRVRRLAEDRLASSGGLGPRRGSPPARALAPGVVAVGGELFLETGALAGKDGLRTAVELFLLAQRTKRQVSLGAREDVRRAIAAATPAALEQFRQDPAVVTVFRELLAGTTHVAATLRAMHDATLLDELVPEFGALDCLAQADPYHAYTVDEHSLAAVAALEGEPAAPDGGVIPPPGVPEREDMIREDLLHRVGRRDLLRLGLLLHDAGKVDGAAGHTERGVALVPDVARRLRLSLDEERHVRFLVAHHLTLSRLAEKREVDAPETLEALLAAVERDPEWLDHFYLLTCADVRAVSPRAFTRWKDGLITRLYERARDVLAGAPAPPRLTDAADFIRALAPRLKPPLDRAALERHLDLAAGPYLSEVDAEEVLLHLELASELRARGARVVVRALPDQGTDRLYVATNDRPALLAAVCGALAGLGLDIHAAWAFSLQDGVVLDRFAVVPDEGLHPGPERWAEVETQLGKVLAGETKPEDLIASRVRRAEAPPAAEAPIREPPVRVRLSNNTTPGSTVLDVSAPDRKGLLFDLTRAIATLGLDVRLAKIATKGNRAVDVFYVTGPDGKKIEDRERLAAIRRALEAAARKPGAVVTEDDAGGD